MDRQDVEEVLERSACFNKWKVAWQGGGYHELNRISPAEKRIQTLELCVETNSPNDWSLQVT